MQILHPTTVSVAELHHALASQGFGVMNTANVAQWAHTTPEALQALSPSWNDMPSDNYLKDGGRYRRRRHSSFVVTGQDVQQVPHRAHWQPVEYNALHGGMERWFEPMLDSTLQAPVWQHLLVALAASASAVRGHAGPWFIEAHQFRIDTTDGIGRPTPEGAHRDGVDFVAVFMVNRVGIKGGETRVFEANGPQGQRFTLSEAWSLMLMDDTRVIHESTPIQPLSEGGHRDTLVLTCRSGGFQQA
jgi:hypothetical protein